MKLKIQEKPIDIIILHTHTTDFNHEEIRFCLRSIEKNLYNVGNVFIVGHKPKWVKGVIHIPCPDLGRTKAHKILHKILFAMNDGRLSERFLYMSDDHYLLKRFNAAKFPYYYDMSLKDAVSIPRNSIYQKMIQDTCDRYPDGRHFNVHSPVVYDKAIFKEAMDSVDWKTKSFIIKSVYANYAGVKGLQMPDCKIREGMDYAKVIENKPFFSIGINLNYHKLRRLMEELYPDASCYETEEMLYLQKVKG